MASRMMRVRGTTIGVAAAMFMAAGGLGSTLTGCDQPPKNDAKQGPKDGGKSDGKSGGKDATKSAAPDDKPKLEPVTIAGKDFKLEPALDRKVRFHGLSGRTEIKPDGGMLFAFSAPQNLYFVMRDCRSRSTFSSWTPRAG